MATTKHMQKNGFNKPLFNHILSYYREFGIKNCIKLCKSYNKYSKSVKSFKDDASNETLNIDRIKYSTEVTGFCTVPYANNLLIFDTDLADVGGENIGMLNLIKLAEDNKIDIIPYLEQTLEVTSPSGGKHHYFRLTDHQQDELIKAFEGQESNNKYGLVDNLDVIFGYSNIVLPRSRTTSKKLANDEIGEYIITKHKNIVQLSNDIFNLLLTVANKKKSVSLKQVSNETKVSNTNKNKSAKDKLLEIDLIELHDIIVDIDDDSSLAPNDAEKLGQGLRHNYVRNKVLALISNNNTLKYQPFELMQFMYKEIRPYIKFNTEADPWDKMKLLEEIKTSSLRVIDNEVYDRTERGTIKRTQENIETYLKLHNKMIALNVLTKKIEIADLQTKKVNVLNDDTFYTQISSDFNNLNCAGMTDSIVAKYIELIAKKAKFNPIKIYLKDNYDKHKDDIDNNIVEKLLSDVLILDEDENRNLAYMLVEKWLLQCVYSAHNVGGSITQGVLVLQGEQGMLKSTFLRKLVTMGDNAKYRKFIIDLCAFDPKNKDDVAIATSTWVTELAEVDVNKKHMEVLKGFLTKSTDSYRPPYAKNTQEFCRYTSFSATTNKKEFLVDETGNRRWWVVKLQNIDLANFNADFINRLWAYIYQMYLDKKPAYLSKSEVDILNKSNKNYEVKEQLTMFLDGALDFDAPKEKWGKLNFTQIKEILDNNFKLKDIKVTSKTLPKALNELGIEQNRSNKNRYYKIPPFRSNILRIDYATGKVISDADNGNGTYNLNKI